MAMQAGRMKAILRFAAILCAGILVSVFVWFLAEFFGLAGYSEMTPFIWFFIYIPIGLIPGSVLIGYLSQPFIKKKSKALLFVSPGFYGAALLGVYTLYGYLKGIYIGAWFITPLLCVMSWTGSSFLGTLWGFNLRAKKSGPAYSFDLETDTTKKQDHNS